jgi:hypothetical protein
MKTRFGYIAPVAAALTITLLSAPHSQAQCGGLPLSLAHPASWNVQHGQAHLLRAALGMGGQQDQDQDSAPIVGFWHVKFISDGVSDGIPGGVPKGAEVDAGYSQWHNDGTEIMNSGGRAPNTGDFCLGVWAKVGPRQYVLNHFAASWDPTQGSLDSAGNPVGVLIGPANIREAVTLAQDGQSFSGTFTIDQYTESSVHAVHLEGTITGTRININTAPSSIF